jgi:hypothetical protein
MVCRSINRLKSIVTQHTVFILDLTNALLSIQLA